MGLLEERRRKWHQPPLPASAAPTNPAVQLRNVREEFPGQRRAGLGGHRQAYEGLRHEAQQPSGH
eukprot:2591596-Alexandrium_andersonii.AAC.1